VAGADDDRVIMIPHTQVNEKTFGCYDCAECQAASADES
jgi:hypothetical protein